MNIETIVVGPFEVNCFILYNKEKKGIIIDPGYNTELISKKIKQNDITLIACLITHGHVDHICALGDIVELFSIENIYMNNKDIQWAFSEENSIPPYYSAPRKPKVPFKNLVEGTTIKIEEISIETIETPGHSPGSVCFYMPAQKTIFTGDTLFKDGIGRTDLPGSDPKAMGNSLKKLAKLPPDTKVMPGHGEFTTIKDELSYLNY